MVDIGFSLGAESRGLGGDEEAHYMDEDETLSDVEFNTVTGKSNLIT